MAKIKIHNILHYPARVLFTLNFEPAKAEFLPSILYALGEENISVPFVVQSIDRRGNLSLSLISEEVDLEWAKFAFGEGLDLSTTTSLEVRKDVALITLYGPHLGERPGVAALLLSALSGDGVEVLALSASINSCLVVVPMNSLSKALLSLSRIFEIPEK